MSAPEQPSDEHAEPHRKARWLDRAVTLLIAAAVTGAVAAVTPALLQASGVELPVAAPAHTGAPLALPHRPPDIKNHPAAPPLFGPPATLFDPDSDGDEGAPRGQLGLTRTPITLRDTPSLSSEISGQVDAGEEVRILRVAGDWVLVYYGGASSRRGEDGALVVGWAKKSEIAVR